jgi:hypothetical protein
MAFRCSASSTHARTPPFALEKGSPPPGASPDAVIRPPNVPPFSCGRISKRSGAGSDMRARGSPHGRRPRRHGTRRRAAVSCNGLLGGVSGTLWFGLWLCLLFPTRQREWRQPFCDLPPSFLACQRCQVVCEAKRQPSRPPPALVVHLQPPPAQRTRAKQRGSSAARPTSASARS